MNRLEAINMIITNGFLLNPLASDDTESALYNKANNWLKQSEIEMQTTYNNMCYFEFNVTLNPDLSKKIQVSPQYSYVDAIDKCIHVRVVKNNGGLYLYDYENNTFEFTKPVECTVKVLKYFEDFSHTMQYYTTCNAIVMACAGEGNEANMQIWNSKASVAYVSLQKENLETLDLGEWQYRYNYKYPTTGEELI